ncbi:S8 family peptidase [Solirubrobacter sp. CPCC 204708]|uniref:S8 family peptidase n=1 Tax=Solirubrobacter deserti TaxID=2282478 RepID=A0ABT4RFC1_9ACTN|nr:S8 family peptidase [Solirubrobacter deserti]MBE2319469.1 S8 family peptidase [Solirubrobacter deserti]MDA0137244.1 S8 family peptidase [Solirubrobacter deserti]
MSQYTKHRWRSRLTVAVVAAVAPFAVGITVANAAPSAQARLATAASKTPNKTVEAIVQFNPTFAEKAATKLVKAHGGKVTGKVPFIHGLVVKLPAKQAKVLAKDAKVVGLTLNTRVRSTGLNANQLATSYPKTTRADKLWARGITGAGIGVGVIDTGIAGDQPDFKDAAGNTRIVANVITSPGAATPGDGLGHGTHVAGIIAGDSSHRPANDPFKGKYVGMAPGANLIAIKASDDAGNSTVLDVINGIAFAVDHKAQFNLRVLNLSLASDTPQSYKTDPLDAAVEYAWQKGIVVVVASGNRGASADAVQYAPANDPFVISVGGIDESANHGRGARADWSSTGVTQDGITKPEVVAPGAHMVSVLSPSSAFAALCPNCAIGGQYFKAGGTSMAAPVVSGAVALLLQARPNLTPDQVKALLMGTDKPVAGNKTGTGAIDVERALYTPTQAVPAVNVRLQPNTLIDYANRAGVDISKWTRSTWSAAPSALSASWARSTWSCGTCAAMGGAIDPQRSTWSRSTWSSAGEDASAEAAQYAQLLEEAEQTGSLEAPIPADAEVPADQPETPAETSAPEAVQ